MRKIIFILSMLLLISAHSFSQIIYHDISPDTTINYWEVFIIKPGTSTTDQIKIWWHPNPEVVVQTAGNCQLLLTNAYPAKLEAGDSIAPSGTWQSGNYDPLNNGSSGNWQTNATDKYLGFRWGGTSNWHYGWLKMTVATGASSFTVKEWAYKTAVNSSIIAGQVNTTGIAGNEMEKIELVQAGSKLSFRNLNSSGQIMLNILDLNGRSLQLRPIEPTEVIDLGGIPGGIYILQLQYNGHIHHFRVNI